MSLIQIGLEVESDMMFNSVKVPAAGENFGGYRRVQVGARGGDRTLVHEGPVCKRCTLYATCI